MYKAPVARAGGNDHNKATTLQRCRRLMEVWQWKRPMNKEYSSRHACELEHMARRSNRAAAVSAALTIGFHWLGCNRPAEEREGRNVRRAGSMLDWIWLVRDGAHGRSQPNHGRGLQHEKIESSGGSGYGMVRAIVPAQQHYGMACQGCPLMRCSGVPPCDKGLLGIDRKEAMWYLPPPLGSPNAAARHGTYRVT